VIAERPPGTAESRGWAMAAATSAASGPSGRCIISFRLYCPLDLLHKIIPGRAKTVPLKFFQPAAGQASSVSHTLPADSPASNPFRLPMTAFTRISVYNGQRADR